MLLPFFPAFSILTVPLNRFSFFCVFFVALITVYAATTIVSLGQDNPGLPDSTDIVVRQLEFEGNENVGTNTLQNLVRTQTNRELFGITGLTPFYGIYKLTGGAFGEDPALLNYQTVAGDLERIRRYYATVGFLEAAVDTNIAIFEEDKARVTFLIEEGERSFIKSITYSGMPEESFNNEEVILDFYDGSELTGQQINDTTYQAELPYITNRLLQERIRIVTFLQNNGYAAATSDSVSALIKTDEQNSQNLHVLFYIKPGKEYRFGDLHIRLAGPEIDSVYTFQQNEVVTGERYTLHGAEIILKKQNSAQTDFNLLTEQLLFQPGATYNYERYISTINEFQNLPMMTIRQFGFTDDGSPPDYAADSLMPVYIFLQTLPKHSISFNVFGLHRYGFGSGAGITYNNNNLFGNAENLQIGVSGSFEYVTSETISDIGADSLTAGTDGTIFQRFETRADYFLPQLTFPFAGLNNNLFFADSRTRYSLSYSRSDQLLFDINFNVGLNLRYQIRHNQRFTSLLDLIDLEILDTNPSARFQESIENEFEDEPLIFQQIIADFRPQISSIFRYTFRSERTDLVQRDYGYFSEYSVAVGGNVPFLIDRFVVTPGTVEGNLPSPARLSENSLNYNRYVKLTANYRRYIPLSANTVFGYSGFIGYAIPYGQNSNIPINQRFYAGGSNDIRGWDYYTLGPGGLQLDNVAVAGGDIKLLAKTELRQTFLEDFLSTNWIIALFADAGNVWYGPGNKILYTENNASLDDLNETRLNLEKGRFGFDTFYKQIAVGSGIGLRLDLTYLIVRFDFAFRIHDLEKGWLNNDTVYFSFGIGHSF